MRGLMMDYPLTLTHMLERSAKLFPNQEIASKMPDGMHRYTYADLHSRVHALAHVLERLGVKPGDKVASLCWNSFRHLELYFAVPCFGAVLHTLNLRLPSDQLAYIIQHAEDKVIFVDASLASILEPIRDQIPCVKQFVILPDESAQTTLAPVCDYEQLIQSSAGQPFVWPRARRNRCLRYLLHIRNHWQSQGRALHAPGVFPAQLLAGLGRRLRDFGARQRSSDRSDVPCQRVGHSLRRIDVRRAHRSHRPPSSAR